MAMPPSISLESSLLTGEWDDTADLSLDSTLCKLVKDVVHGSFKDVLTSPLARQLLSTSPNLSANDPISSWFSFPPAKNYEQELSRLAVAVAFLNAFMQVNWTGPDLDVKPLDVLSTSESLSDDILDQKSIAELAYGGEPAYHLAQHPFFFRLAQILLHLDYAHVTTIQWWRLRTWNVHEQLLDEPASVPHDAMISIEQLAKSLAPHPDLVGRLWLERGLLEHYQGNDKAALDFFLRSARATELQYELTGALGKRTKFQETDHTQLILLAESRARGDNATSATRHTVSSQLPETLALNDDTLLEQTEYTSSNPSAPGSTLSHLDPSSQPSLHPLDQCILLSLCLNVRNTSPAHGLTNEQMSPYIARVISHPENWSVHTMALLLRSRLEAHRTRTVERSTLQLQALLDQMPTADSSLRERLLYVHSIPLPSKWEMERELALRFLSIGVVKSALEIFERLEMWEEAVKCWQALEQSDKAINVVRDLLEGRKAEADAVLVRSKSLSTTKRSSFDAAREAKLWCLLGDLEPALAKEHYTHAWEFSKNTAGRAMRSLGGWHFARGEWEETAECLRKAVAINPLMSRSWFILGCACVRLQDWPGARDAFARCVALDEEDGESWNNLATVYLRMKGSDKKTIEGVSEKEESDETDLTSRKTPSTFDNKMLAFRALKQGLKFSYDNWRMWSNYMIIAMDIGELSEACRALGRIVEERAAKDGEEAVDEDVLDRLVDAVTRAPANQNDAVDGATGSVPMHNPNEGHGLARRVEDLFVRIILPRVSSPRVFRARARLLTWQSKWEDALKAYMEAYRLSVAGTMEKGETDVERFKEAVREVEEIVEMLRNFGPRVGEGAGRKWAVQARSILRTFMGRARENFEDEKEWVRLEELMEEIKSEI